MKEEKKKPGKDWLSFLEFFPDIELPVTLTEEYSGIFTKYNKALPAELIEIFILEKPMFFGDSDQPEPENEVIEYVPCFRLPEEKNYHALVYWKADLLKYEYILHTYDNFGKTIAKQIIASTSSDGKTIRQIVATIDPDLDIYIIGGDSSKTDSYDPEKSRAFSLEINPFGQIIHHFEENN